MSYFIDFTKIDQIKESLLTCDTKVFVDSFTDDRNSNFLEIFAFEIKENHRDFLEYFTAKLDRNKLIEWLNRASGRSFEQEFRKYLIIELDDIALAYQWYREYGEFEDREKYYNGPDEIEKELADCEHTEHINALTTFLIGVKSAGSSVNNFSKNYLYDFHILGDICKLLLD